MANTFYKNGEVATPSGADDKAKFLVLLSTCNDGGTHVLEGTEPIAVGNSANNHFALPVLNANVTIRTRGIDDYIKSGKLLDNTLRDSALASLFGFTTAGTQASPMYVAAGCSNYTFDGVQFTNMASSLVLNHLIQVGVDGYNGNQPSSRSGLPSNLTWNRCVIAMTNASGRINSSRFGLVLHGSNFVITNSNFSGFRHGAGDGATGQGDYGGLWLGGVDGVRVQDNYIESGGERVFVGQTTVYSRNIKFRRNKLTMPLSWVGSVYVKNSFETKNVENLDMRGNIFERVDNSGGQNYALNFNMRTEGFPGIVGNGIRNVKCRYNIVRSVLGVVTAPGYDGDADATDYAYGNGPTRAFDFSHNLCYDVTSGTWGDGQYAYAALFFGGDFIRIAHNLFQGTKTGLIALLAPKTTGIYTSPDSEAFRPRCGKFRHFHLTNNIWTSHVYGLRDDYNDYIDGGPAWTGLNQSVTESPFAGNVVGYASGGEFVDWTGGYDATNALDMTEAEVLAEFVDDEVFDFRVKAGSPLLTAGVGGVTPGPDHRQLKAEVGPLLWDLPY